MTDVPSNRDDVIDSRDIIQAIEDLTDELEAAGVDPNDPEGNYEDENGLNYDVEVEELKSLQDVADQAENYGDWEYGEVLIRRTYWVEWVKEFASDIGVVDSNANWPNNHIDWDAAANDLEQDYMSIDFDGVEYLMRL